MQIFLAVWREFYRQKANLFFTVFFPSILVFILGTLLEQWNISEYEVPEMQVAYVAEEEYPAFEQFLAGMETERLLKVDRVQDKETALGQVDEKYVAVLAYQPEDRRIDIYQGSDSVADRTLHAMLEGYSGLEQAAVLSVQSGVELKITGQTDYVKPKNLGVERSMIDYYAVAMLVMILFFAGGVGGSTNIYQFRKNGLFQRVAATPADKAKVFCLMMLGNLPMVAVEIGAVSICSVVLFGAHYGRNLADNLLLFLFFGVAGMALVAFGTVVGIVVRMNPTTIILPLIWAVLFFSGSFARLKIDGVTQLMPAWHIQEAAFDLTLFGNYGRILSVGGICLICCIVFVAIGAVLFCKKGGVEK